MGLIGLQGILFSARCASACCIGLCWHLSQNHSRPVCLAQENTDSRSVWRLAVWIPVYPRKCTLCRTLCACSVTLSRLVLLVGSNNGAFADSKSSCSNRVWGALGSCAS